MTQKLLLVFIWMTQYKEQIPNYFDTNEWTEYYSEL